MQIQWHAAFSALDYRGLRGGDQQEERRATTKGKFWVFSWPTGQVIMSHTQAISNLCCDHICLILAIFIFLGTVMVGFHAQNIPILKESCGLIFGGPL